MTTTTTTTTTITMLGQRKPIQVRMLTLQTPYRVFTGSLYFVGCGYLFCFIPYFLNFLPPSNRSRTIRVSTAKQN